MIKAYADKFERYFSSTAVQYSTEDEAREGRIRVQAKAEELTYPISVYRLVDNIVVLMVPFPNLNKMLEVSALMEPERGHGELITLSKDVHNLLAARSAKAFGLINGPN